jgi:hypothetical protein
MIKQTLSNGISKIFIISYKESTSQLERELESQGFKCEVIRQKDSKELKGYAGIYRCFLNHKTAWKNTVREKKPAVIVEADFVPVRNFGSLPLPFEERFGICWLYTCGPRIYSASKEGYIEGGSTSTVAYVLNSKSAKLMLEFAEKVEKEAAGKYTPWDSDVDGFFISKGIKNFIVFKNYGEHGGSVNKEHKKHKIKWGGVHRADVLYDKLAFMPNYASGCCPYIKYLRERWRGYSRGLLRLFSGRLLRPTIAMHSSNPLKLIWFAVARFVIFSRLGPNLQ